MPIFARRRIAKMLEDLSPMLTPNKRRDVITRLEHTRTDQAMASEAELGLLWALSRCVGCEIEPQIEGWQRVPDALSQGLFPPRRAVVEIIAISDETMSGEAVMRRAASILSQEATRLRAKSGRKLFFTFHEISGYEQGVFCRRRCVGPTFQLDDQIRAQLQQWLSGWPASRTSSLRLTNAEIDVTVQYREYVHPLYNFFSSMPAVAYSLTDNTLYRGLVEKENQLPPAQEGLVRCIFVADAGCHLLRELRPISMSPEEVSGEQIVQHFMSRSTIDIVAVFSPILSPPLLSPHLSRLRWQPMVYYRPDTISESEAARVQQIASSLPPAQFEAYNARALHRQGAFSPQARGWWLPESFTTGHDGIMTVKISARAIQEILAGRVSVETAMGKVSGDRNVFEIALSCGRVIKSARFEEGGVDEDDDYLIFEFGPDVAAAKIPGGKG